MNDMDPFDWPRTEDYRAIVVKHVVRSNGSGPVAHVKLTVSAGTDSGGGGMSAHCVFDVDGWQAVGGFDIPFMATVPCYGLVMRRLANGLRAQGWQLLERTR